MTMVTTTKIIVCIHLGAVRLTHSISTKTVERAILMGCNWPEVATIELSGSIGCIQHIIDIFKKLKLKIEKLEKNPHPWEISCHIH